MIQRVQTLYLFLASLLSGLLFFKPICTIVDGEKTYEMTYRAIQSVNQTTYSETSIWLLTVVLLLAVVLSFVAIFKYKNRKNQILISYVPIVANVIAFAAIYFYSATASGDVTYSLIAIFPLISAILIALAILFIKKDDKLVKSMDRIR